MINMDTNYWDTVINMLYCAPDKLPALFSLHSVFVAGGISNCPDWQSDIIRFMATNLYDVVNPRRETGFDTTGATAREQIEWEHEALSKVDSCIFWFPCETLCPISLFELSKQLLRAKQQSVKLVVGWHPNYARAFDLKVQIELENIPKDNLLYADVGWDGFVKAVIANWG
jgi:hypothetical protein